MDAKSGPIHWIILFAWWSVSRRREMELFSHHPVFYKCTVPKGSCVLAFRHGDLRWPPLGCRDPGEGLARCKGSNESEVTSQLFGRLSLALMRVNAMMLSTRCHSDDFPLPKIDGIMWLDNLLLIYTQHFSGNIHFHLSPELILRDPPALR